MGGNGGTGTIQPAVRHPSCWGVCAAGGDPHGEASDVVPAAAAVHGRGVDHPARAAVAADIDVFCADAA